MRTTYLLFRMILTLIPAALIESCLFPRSLDYSTMHSPTQFPPIIHPLLFPPPFTTLGKNEQIKSKIQECEKLAKDGKFRLRDILSVPMQRILKYPLLLRDLHKYTVDPHLDREGMTKFSPY